ncbi:hypothetical protein EZV62_000432 [Acer yangbiense]|uniref:Uncharacterized protein n=1 Tax=Acer yangbiense TaxID=1000413 RepID=A0A5C7IR43_9ROSI|nr:hypothetical protein EZV62_000432 [Acer yangbiense]
MGGNQSRDCSIDIDQNLEEVFESGADCCIYRVPPFLSEQNEEIYTPRFISIGPLHYGSAKLMGMEKQKTRFLSSFKGRVGAHKLKEFETYLRNQEQLICNHYSVTSKLPIRKFLSVILHNAVFIVELLTRYTIDPSEFLLNNEHLRNKIFTYLILIENQILFFVLDRLFSSTFPNSEGYPSFIHICHTYFVRERLKYVPPFPTQLQIKHFTDLMRHFLIPVEQSTGPPPGLQQFFDIPSVTKLYASRLEFKAMRGSWTKITLGKSKSGWDPGTVARPKAEVNGGSMRPKSGVGCVGSRVDIVEMKVDGGLEVSKGFKKLNDGLSVDDMTNFTEVIDNGPGFVVKDKSGIVAGPKVGKWNRWARDRVR